MYEKLEEVAARYDELTNMLSDPEVLKDQQSFAKLSKEHAEKVLKKGPWPKFFFTKNGKGGIARKTYLKNVGGKLPTNLWKHDDVGHTDEAKKEMLNMTLIKDFLLVKILWTEMG